jgi:formate--tetrahydrofolate ligase
LEEQGINLSLVEAWEKGGSGAEDLAKKVVDLTKNPATLKYTYNLEDSIKTKIEKIAKNIYGADGVEYSKEAETEIAKIEEMGYSNLPVCIAKTQYSFSDDAKNLICDKPFKINVKEIQLKAGSKFIVVLTGKIFTMPGLPKIPAAENINIDENGNIAGIF